MSPDSEDDLDAIDVQLGHHQPPPLLSHSQAIETSLAARLLHHPQPIQGWNTSAPPSPSSSFFFPVSRQLTSDPTQIALPPSPLPPTPSEGESDQQRRLAPAGATYLFGSNHEDIASPSRVLHPTLVRLPSSMPGSCPSSRPGTPSSIASASKDERQCRICFGDGTDEAELGRLISPCVCRGSMRHVHVKCLAHWRKSSSNKKAFWACPQCSFKYHFARTRASGLALNPYAILFTTILLFFAITLLSGHLLALFLSIYVTPPELLASSPFATAFDREPHSIGEILLEDPASSQTARVFVPSSTVFEVIRASVGVFAGGEAEQVLRTIWETISSVAQDRLPSSMGPKTGWQGVYSRFLAHLSAFLALVRSHPPLSFLLKPSISHQPSAHLPAAMNHTLLSALIYRFTLGVSFVGSVSFVSLLLSLSLLPAFSLFNTWNFPRFARVGRRRTRAAANLAREGPGVGAFIMVALVTVGIVRTVVGLYGTLREFSSHLLLRAETAILEVSPSGEELEPLAPGLERIEVKSESEAAAAAAEEALRERWRRRAGVVGDAGAGGVRRRRPLWDPPGGWVGAW